MLNMVTSTITEIDLTLEKVSNGVMKLKPSKAIGSDDFLPKLLKYAGNSTVASLASIFRSSAQTNEVFGKWKTANQSALYKKNEVVEKDNYRPISLISVPGKIMESCAASTITNHQELHNLRNDRRRAYKKGHSTELYFLSR